MTTDEQAKGRDEAKAQARRAAQREVAASWDRLGQFMQTTNDVGQRMVQRNLELWTSVSRKLDGGEYTTDDAATDAMRAFTAAMANAEDLWMGLASPVDRDNTATVVPTAFLFFKRSGAGHDLIDPTVIRVPNADNRELPPRAEIVLSGTDRDGAERLRTSLRAYRDTDQIDIYLVVAVAHPTDNLVAGAYDGFIYLTDPPQALADLRVVVEATDPASSPAV
jgi:hypothetical protein